MPAWYASTPRMDAAAWTNSAGQTRWWSAPGYGADRVYAQMRRTGRAQTRRLNTHCGGALSAAAQLRSYADAAGLRD